ncbi:MAG TPA: FAD/NAD(P)-binding oxidoreductase [Chitinophagales bacterium]|nr:FAD/NAD(P)-binding oxidoreductase [Chitinophagales bacterium]HRK29101.1 FAD/NAD(P)-binding oxidoreductase [Chitinophagales bacterium]
MHFVIIGNGVAGITAALYLRKLNSECRITVISAESPYFFSRTALMYVYMGHLTFNQTKPYEDHFWQKNRIGLLNDRVTSVNFEQKTLHLQSGNTIGYHKLLLATGSTPNKLQAPGSELAGVQNLYSLHDLELLNQNSRGIHQAVVVGGGLTGAEVAEMLLSRGISVTFLVRENSYMRSVLPPEESGMVANHIKAHGVQLKLATQLQAILPNEQDRVKAVTTHNGEVISAQLVVVTTGVSPNIAFLKNTGLATDKGILVNQHLQTNIPDVFAAGDCAQFLQPLPDRQAIEQTWYTAQMQGKTAAFNLLGHTKPYLPRLWFNAAKFFDLEYQTFGLVNSLPLPHTTHLYRKHPTQNKCIRLVYHTQSGALLGVNALGVRLRHEVIENWIAQQVTYTYALAHFRQALFDAEFTPSAMQWLTGK